MQAKKNKTNPLIMGIYNITPDSFFFHNNKSSLGIFNDIDYQYADIIDFGCESSKPGAKPVSEYNELSRLTNFLDKKHRFSKKLSIDTYKPVVARFALENGFNMINDIKSGGNNDSMLNLAAKYDCPIVLMHMKGIPANMQDSPYYKNVIDEILTFFNYKLKIAKNLGISDENIILDPGIGFGKRIEDNDKILLNIDQIKQLGYPVLLGLSRKSFLSIDEDSPEYRLPATMGATVIAIQQGVDVLRVHDVEETYKLISIINRISSHKSEISEIVYS